MPVERVTAAEIAAEVFAAAQRAQFGGVRVVVSQHVGDDQRIWLDLDKVVVSQRTYDEIMRIVASGKGRT